MAKKKASDLDAMRQKVSELREELRPLASDDRLTRTAFLRLKAREPELRLQLSILEADLEEAEEGLRQAQAVEQERLRAAARAELAPLLRKVNADHLGPMEAPALQIIKLAHAAGDPQAAAIFAVLFGPDGLVRQWRRDYGEML